MTVAGLAINIENPEGSERRGVDPDGTPWANRMWAHYGYIVGTKGADGDAVDVFVGPWPEGPHAWILNQTKVGGAGFDEHKVLLGFASADQALSAYRHSYSQGWKNYHPPIALSLEQLRWWLEWADKTIPFSLDLVPADVPAELESSAMDSAIFSAFARPFPAVAWGADNEPQGESFLDAYIRLRRHDGTDERMLWPMSLDDVAAEGFQASAMDAAQIEAGMLQPKMEQLMRLMEAASTTIKPIALLPLKMMLKGGKAHVPAIFEMSDGQTVTIWNYSPDLTPAKLSPADPMIIWKVQVNKADFTASVAPENGKEINHRELARRIMRFAEKNKDAFARNNKKRAEEAAAIQGLKDELAQKQATLEDLNGQIAQAKTAKEASELALAEQQAAQAKAAAMAAFVMPSVFPLKESSSHQGNREGAGEVLVRVDAKALKAAIEKQTSEPLQWDESRTKAIDELVRSGGAAESAPQVFTTPEGALAVGDGRHRISYAAAHGMLIDVRASKEDEAKILRALSSGEEPEKPQQVQPAKASGNPVEQDRALWERIENGSASVEEFKEGFRSLVSRRGEVEAAFSAMKKDELLEFGGPSFAYRNKSLTKPEIIAALWRDLLGRFSLRSAVSYTMAPGRDGYLDAVGKIVNATTEEDLSKYAKWAAEQKQQRAEQSEQRERALKDPKSLSDFNTYLRSEMLLGKSFKEARLGMTLEQRIKYDELSAEETKSAREAAKREISSNIKPASQSVGGKVVETTHTKTNASIFVVQLESRLGKEDYDKVNAAAKKLGGYYSSFRGNGAIPGFIFSSKESADAFLLLAGGDSGAAKDIVSKNRDAFEDDRSQSAAERLTEMADKMEAEADSSMSVTRKQNTARRARMASYAEKEAGRQKALAQTMRNIAGAISDGRAKFIDSVRQKVQVEFLEQAVLTAKSAEIQSKYKTYAQQQQHNGEPASGETADFAEFPAYTAMRSDLAFLARALLELSETKRIGQKLMKVADDVSAAFKSWAKDEENLNKIRAFTSKETGGSPKFASESSAEAAISRSGFKGIAIPWMAKRGLWDVVLSPSAAIERGIWHGDKDKKITLSADFGAELVELARKVNSSTKRIPLPWQFEIAYERRKRLSGMAIETPAEFRSAMREFIAMRMMPQGPNKIREMERAMIGAGNDGLDFFPTPAKTVDEMVDVAEIKPGMRVLEPSAGWGHIAERLATLGASPDVIELSNSRRELLDAKGFSVVGDDFLNFRDDVGNRSFTFGDLMEAPDGTRGILRGKGGLGSDRVRLVSDDEEGRTLGSYSFGQLVGVERRGVGAGYDRIIMNPPFSDRMDAEHVRHAYSLLKPGGRIVAIMGEGVFFGQDKKAQEFREWLEKVGGSSEKLAEGTFNDPSLPASTNANTRMVVINKPEDAEPVTPGPNKPTTTNEGGESTEAPAQESEQGVSAEGRENPVKTAKGTKVVTGFAVIEADRLIVSHDADGRENPEYPMELQPRDRARAESQAWVKQTANNLDPDSLGRTTRADSGAPIVGPDRVVESGNGRTMAIIEAYRIGKADEYRAWLESEAEYFGVSPEKVRAMKRPVLVRVRKSAVDRRAFAVEANQDDKLAMTATEKARSDARRLDDVLVSKLSEDGNLLATGNRDFLAGFLQSLGSAEAAQYTTSDGQPTASLIDRVQAAIFAKAYADDRLLELTADAAKPEVANIIAALNAAAPDFIRAMAGNRTGTEDTAQSLADGIQASLDQQAVKAIIEATNIVKKAKADGTRVEDVIAQQGLFGDMDPTVAAMALFISQNNRSAKRLGTAFKAMANFIGSEAEKSQTADMFGGGEPVSLPSVLEAANREMQKQYGEGAFALEQFGLFSQPQTAPGGINIEPHVKALTGSTEGQFDAVPINEQLEKIGAAVDALAGAGALTPELDALAVRALERWAGMEPFVA